MSPREGEGSPACHQPYSACTTPPLLSSTGSIIECVLMAAMSRCHVCLSPLLQAVLLVRFGLNKVLKALAGLSKSPVQWDKSKLYYILREVWGRGIQGAAAGRKKAALPPPGMEVLRAGRQRFLF